MHHASFVRVFERIEHRQQHRQPDFMMAASQRFQAVALDILHGDKVAVAIAVEFMNPNDVGMHHLPGQATFVLQQFDHGRICGQCGTEDFQRYITREVVVSGQPDFAHPSLPQPGDKGETAR